MKMDEFRQRIQTLLMKKEREYGKLCQLSSRITAESIIYIDSILHDVVEVCESCKIPTGRRNLHNVRESVEAFKFFLLNTKFRCQELLKEDIVHGHLVGMCPSLSPHLFIEFLWRLNFEDILTHSVPYLPLDLTVELLEIVPSCVSSLHFERGLRLVTSLVEKSQKKLVQAKSVGVQSTNIREMLGRLAAITEKLLILLGSEKFSKLSELRGNAKHERFGIVLKKLLDVTEASMDNDSGLSWNVEDEKRYKLVFGEMPFSRCEEEVAEQHLTIVHNELTKLLLQKVKEVDCSCYMAWVEVQDPENPSITLQRGIGLRCHTFVEKAEKDAQFEGHEHLIETLGNFISKPEKGLEALMTLEDLLKNLNEGNEACMKELLKRYENWDHEVFELVEKQESLMDVEDALTLLDYLVFVLNGPHDVTFKQKVHHGTLTMLMSFKAVDFTTIALNYILKHDGSNALECSETESMFKQFISCNPNFESPADYRRLLIFLMRNPKKIMRILVKVAIGHREFCNAMLPMAGFFILLPFMRIKDNENISLLLGALRDVVQENVEWKVKRLDELLVHVIRSWPKMDEAAKDITNVVLIPYLLRDNYSPVCLKAILISCRNLARKSDDLPNLLLGLAKKLTRAREDKMHSRFENSEVLQMLDMLIEQFFNRRWDHLEKEKLEIISKVDPFLSPYDSFTMWRIRSQYLQVSNILHKYERLCFSVMIKVQSNARLDDDLKLYLQDFTFLQDDFLRHLFLNCTIMDVEYLKIVLYRFCDTYFKWSEGIFDFAHLKPVISQACQLCLEYPEDFAPLTFPCLLKMCWHLIRSDSLNGEGEQVTELWKGIMRAIENSVCGTPYAEDYGDIMVVINNVMSDADNTEYERVMEAVGEFLKRCTEHGERYEYSGNRNREVSRYRVSHHFIKACLAVTGLEMTDCLMEINKSLL